jgi:hypothetical protein
VKDTNFDGPKKPKSIFSGWEFWRGLFIGWAILLVPYLVLAPAYGDYMARVRVETMFMHMKSLKPLVESRLKTNSPQLGFGENAAAIAELENKRNAMIHVTQAGTIIGAALIANAFGQNKRAAVIILEPTKEQNGQIEWKCSGMPQREIPVLCRF